MATKDSHAGKAPTPETYDELQQAYEWFNVRLFDDELPPCLITLQRHKRTYGYFSPERFASRKGGRTDEIAMNPAYFATRPVEDVLSTLAHEMAHLWQHHFGAPVRRAYHNKEWGQKMKQIGLHPSNTGAPGGRETGEQMTHYVIAGGAFEAACTELMASSFSLSWYDRFPAGPVVEGLMGVDDPKLSGIALAGGELTRIRLGGSDDLDEGGADVSTYTEPPTRKGLDVVTPTPGENRSNREKYTCPECEINAWGKPDLKLICGACNVDLESY